MKTGTCTECGKDFEKGKGVFGLDSMLRKKKTGICNPCLDFHVDVKAERKLVDVPKPEHLRGSHSGLIRHFGKVPEPSEEEPDFRQTTKAPKKTEPEKPQLYNDGKHCAFCSGEFKKGEKTKKHLEEYPVHEKCPSYPTFKQYTALKANK